MGNVCGGGLSEEDKRFAARSRKIQRDNEEDHEMERNKVKLLLLGAGESGKSTVFKQMRQLYGDAYNADEMAQFRLFIHQNVIQTIEDLCDIAKKEFPDDPLLTSAEFMATEPSEGISDMRNFRRFPELSQERAATIRALWESPLFQKLWKFIILGEGRHKYQIIESAKGFLDRLDDLTAPGWVPTEQDILHCRVRTSGIREERLLVPSANAVAASTKRPASSASASTVSSSAGGQHKIFQFFDVGGQRNERRKWIHCFDGVHAVIFIVALSEFDQSLWEDGTANRMEDSIQLFQNTTLDDAFKHSAFILFLNKKDLFMEKIKVKNLKDQPEWRDYAGKPCDFQDGVDYFSSKFKAAAGMRGEDMFVHCTMATDKQNVQYVFNACKEVITTFHLRDLGML